MTCVADIHVDAAAAILTDAPCLLSTGALAGTVKVLTSEGGLHTVQWPHRCTLGSAVAASYYTGASDGCISARSMLPFLKRHPLSAAAAWMP